MKTILSPILCILVVLMLIASPACSKKKINKTKKGKNKAGSIEWLNESIEANHFDSPYFAARAKIKAKEPGKMTVPLNATIRMRQDSAIWASVSINAGVKIEVARALFTPDSIRLIDKYNKLYYVESYDYLLNFIAYPLDFYDLQNLILGNALNQSPFVNADKRNNEYVLHSEECKLNLDVNNLLIQKMLLSEAGSNRSLQAVHEEYEGFGAKNFSKKRYYELKADDLYTLKVNFYKLSNSSDLSFKFKVSSKYKRAH